jgi:hypothetical protein
MNITVLIPDLDAATCEATYDRVQAALEAAGIDTFELHLQTAEQHEAHPIAGGASDFEIREYLTRDASAFAAFLRREIRRDPAWWRRELRKQERIGTLGNLDRVLRP